MKALNLYILSRYSDTENYTEYYGAMAETEKAERYSQQEIDSLRIFVDTLLAAGAEPELFENYFYGFEIPQIGKEFDILKIGDNFLLNIELKSRMDAEKAKAQLVKNQFYLRHLSDRQQSLITFDAQSGRFFELAENQTLCTITAKELIERMAAVAEAYDREIEKLFSVSHFLISPLNTPKRFLNGEYFLTLQQREIKDAILKNIDSGKAHYYAVSGAAGTGKTLLIYDIAKELSKRGKVGMIHCGQLAEGHKYISEVCENFDIFPVVWLKTDYDTSSYQYLLVDETQRIYKLQLVKLLEKLNQKSIPVIFSYDSRQTLTRSESEDAIPNLIESLAGLKSFHLTNKIRTNPELAAFIQGMGDEGKINRNYFYHAVDLLYANNVTEAQNMITVYQSKGYQFINHTPSRYLLSTLNEFDTTVVAHKVIGQEFDNVLVMIDENFYYEGGLLKSKAHPNWNYLYHKMLFQEVTRVREKLAIIVLGNPDVFSRLLKIKMIRTAQED